MKKNVKFCILTVLLTSVIFSSLQVVSADQENTTVNIDMTSSLEESEMTTNTDESVGIISETTGSTQTEIGETDSTEADESTLSSSNENQSVIDKTPLRAANKTEYGKFVSIVSEKYSIYNEISDKVIGSSKDILGKTFEAKERVVLDNGVIYLCLFDYEGHQIGFIDENATKVGGGRQGIHQTYGKYVTVTKDGYSTYNNFSWTKRNTTKNMYAKTYYARGKYQHFNGQTYVSLFDDGGKWYGYVNENATRVASGRQGIYQKYNKYVTITNNNYSTYSNFSWTKRNYTKDMSGRTYEARGKYQHINGLTYLSLFDSSGKWYGYVNQNAATVANGRQGVYQRFNKHVIINSKNYSMWQNFNWAVRKSSSTIFQQGLIAKGKYVHFNGSVYYSVYDAMGGWHGYINASGVNIVNYKNNSTTYYSQMAIGAYNGCAATALYTAFQAKGYAKNVSLVNFINGLPLSDSNADDGQIGDPWGNTLFKRVISPIGLTKYARKYTNNTEIITGSSTDRIITEINSGNLVLYWGMYLMKDPNIKEQPQHVMIARGYKIENGKEYILLQDSGLYSTNNPLAVRWYEKNAFDSYLTNKYRKMMVVR